MDPILIWTILGFLDPAYVILSNQEWLLWKMARSKLCEFSHDLNGRSFQFVFLKCVAEGSWCIADLWLPSWWPSLQYLECLDPETRRPVVTGHPWEKARESWSNTSRGARSPQSPSRLFYNVGPPNVISWFTTPSNYCLTAINPNVKRIEKELSYQTVAPHIPTL